ncbi:formylglycine-generating enzyme family protein [Nitrospira sp. M1]
MTHLTRQKSRLGKTKTSLIVATVFLISSGTAALADQPQTDKDMAYIPFSAVVMGIDQDESKRDAQKGETQTMYQKRASMPWSREAFHDEGPAHWVVLDSYMIDKYEVSNKKFEQFMKDTGHTSPAYWDDPRLNKPEQPVVGVNWSDANSYCKWEGKRLPTEAEWEHAARGSDGRIYPWGNKFDEAKANFGKNLKATLPVDSLPEGASPFGLHHMAGNVFEWVEDWYDPNFYKKLPHPVNTKGPLKPIWLGGTGTYVDRLTTGEKRVIRGGSWIAAKSSITSTHRFWNNPMNNSYGVGLGFRCAKAAPQSIVNDVRTLTIEAMKNIGIEKHEVAKKNLDQALQLDPTNEELKQMRSLLN